MRRLYGTETVDARLLEGVHPPEVAVQAAGYGATLALPPALGGVERHGEAGDATSNPEQLFGGAYSGCFTFALEYVGGRRKADLRGLHLTATVRIGRGEDGGNDLEVDLLVRMPNVPQADAERLCQEATRYCPFHRAVEATVHPTMTVEGRTG
jgi:Ohr subfamily peroxiredoxin